jgi:hypothetical protein
MLKIAAEPQLQNDTLQSLIDTLTNKGRFMAEWASKTAKLARDNAKAHGSGGGFWEREVAGSVEIEAVGGDSFLIVTRDPKAVHKQFGGIIRRPNGGLLTIPLEDEAKGKRAGEIADLFFVRANDKLFLAQQNGETLTFMYVLCYQTRPQKAEPWWPTDAEVTDLGTTIAEKYIRRAQQ